MLLISLSASTSSSSSVLFILICCAVAQTPPPPPPPYQYQYQARQYVSNVRMPARPNDDSAQHGGAVQIPIEFFESANAAELTKVKLQRQLQNFLENLHRNLTTSTVLNTIIDASPLSLLSLSPSSSSSWDVDNHMRQQMAKLNDLSAYFESASEASTEFASASEQFFEATKNASNAFLMKLRQVPAAQPMAVKLLLTNYFAEMEYFHIMFAEVIDIALEYTQDTLRDMQTTFINYADIQREVLHSWNFKPDEICCNRYMDFLQKWSAAVYKCAAGHELDVAYDVYAMTVVHAKYIMRQLEFRLQRLFNCLHYGKYRTHCKFLQNAEQDFVKLIDKLEELEMYYDIKTKRGRVSINRIRRHDVQGKCLPYGFPDVQMSTSLKTCFYFPQNN